MSTLLLSPNLFCTSTDFLLPFSLCVPLLLKGHLGHKIYVRQNGRGEVEEEAETNKKRDVSEKEEQERETKRKKRKMSSDPSFRAKFAIIFVPSKDILSQRPPPLSFPLVHDMKSTLFPNSSNLAWVSPQGSQTVNKDSDTPGASLPLLS